MVRFGRFRKTHRNRPFAGFWNENDADLNKAMVLVHTPSLLFFLLSLPMGGFEDVVAASSAHKQVRKTTMDVSAKEDSESDEVESKVVDKDLEVEVSEH